MQRAVPWIRITSHPLPLLSPISSHQALLQEGAVFLNLGGASAFNSSPDRNVASSHQPERLTLGALRKVGHTETILPIKPDVKW